ncbi:MAG TPA: PQQ-dependent sugar dehydrogenase, partial [Anaerolineae bacterium]
MFHHFKHLLVSAGTTGAFIAVMMLIVTASAPRSIEPAAASASSYTLSLRQVATGLAEPAYLTHAGDDSGRLFVVERAGRIRVITNGGLLSTPFLNITNRVYSSGGEQGLLGVAFDPNYATNGTLYVDYTTNVGHAGDTVIARYVVANPAADVAIVLTVTNLITIYQPEANHNGGQLQFGPNDGYLYISLGDG